MYKLLKTLNISYFPHSSSSKGKREKWASGFTQQLVTNSLKQLASMKRVAPEGRQGEDVGSTLPAAGAQAPPPCRLQGVEMKVKAQVASRSCNHMIQGRMKRRAFKNW